MNINLPQLKIESINIISNKIKKLHQEDLDKNTVVERIKDTLSLIIHKFSVTDQTMKLIDRDPVVFDIIPKDGVIILRFTIEFPPECDDIKNELIYTINSYT